MRIVFFRHGKEYELFNKNRQDLIERVLFTFFIILFTVVIFSQISLLGTESDNLSISSGSLDGAPLGVEEYLYSAGTIEFKLMSSEQDPGLAILVNGDKVAVFDSKDIKLEVIDGDIIELDGSGTGESEVALSAVSSNVNRNYVGEIFSVNGNIEKVMEVKIEND